MAERYVEATHQHALAVLNEQANEIEKLYSVASAGRAYCKDRVNERNIFTAIEDMAADMTLVNSLRKLINELGRAAGSGYVEGPRHE